MWNGLIKPDFDARNVPKLYFIVYLFVSKNAIIISHKFSIYIYIENSSCVIRFQIGSNWIELFLENMNYCIF